MNNIKWHHGKVTKEDRYQLNKYRSVLIWLTGLPASGKSTIAHELEFRLFQHQIRSYVLDGDNIRHGLNKGLGFSPEDRAENIRRIGEVAKLFVDAGIITIAAFVSPYQADRLMVRQLFSDGEMIEVYVKCALKICEQRDPKNLYQKARRGEIKNFTGVSDPYEEPKNPEIILETDKLSVNESVELILSYLTDKAIFR
jgi:adenylylsulfate kinase